MTPVTPKLGIKMSSADANAYIDQLNKKVMQRWQERVTRGPFMSKFLEGTLPRSAIKLFFKNWGNFTVEINTLVSVSYHKHIGFFKRHPDLMAPLGTKIADEFIHPKPPGHVLVMLETAAALGLTKDQILREPMLPECRAILDFKRQLMWEGTVAEWWFSMLTEEPIGHWSAMWFKTLTKNTALPANRPFTSRRMRKPISKSTQTASWDTAASTSSSCSAFSRTAMPIVVKATTWNTARWPLWTFTASCIGPQPN
jgi:pyrroloquinoline quinone (PQQ) biosynthesis protein C